MYRELGGDADKKRIAAIEEFIFKRGGISAEIKRIIYRSRGIFSAIQIHLEISRRFPYVTPAEFQIQDCLDHFEQRKFIERIPSKSSVKIYKKHDRFNSPLRRLWSRVETPSRLAKIGCKFPCPVASPLFCV